MLTKDCQHVSSPPFEAGETVIALQTVTSYKGTSKIEAGKPVKIEHVGLDDCEWYLNVCGRVDAFPASAFSKQSE